MAQRVRGFGGCALLWNRQIDTLVTSHPDGSQRTAVITLDSTPPLCIISCYMPCRGTYTKMQYQDILDEVTEIVKKFSPHYTMLLCADVNGTPASHTLDMRKDRVKEVTEFLTHSGLRVPEDVPKKPTYYHAGAQSQIDFILTSEMPDTIVMRTSIPDWDATSCSPHVPIIAIIEGVRIQRTLRQSTKAVSNGKISWHKIDSTAYMEKVQERLSWDRELSTTEDVSGAIAYMSDILKGVTEELKPKTKVRKGKKRKPMHPSLIQLIRRGRKLNWEWKNAGRPNQSHPLSVARKDVSKQIRKCQRMAAARHRNNSLQAIMNARTEDSKMFHRLVAKQRTVRTSAKGIHLSNGDCEISDPDEVLEVWRDHFGGLATPGNYVSTDDSQHSLILRDQVQIIKQFNSRLDPPAPITSLEVLQAIRRLNKGKAYDTTGMSAEHLQFAEHHVADFLTPIYNRILVLGELPAVFKEGQVTPIFKGGDKPRDRTDSYRGITVSSIIGKAFERILADHQESLWNQSQLQNGFTQGMSPYFASVLKTEAIATRKGPLFVATLDAQKAFDVVNHDRLLVKTFNTGLSGALWAAKQDSYNGLQSCVKWEGSTSQFFRVEQGVKQGGITSPTDYKVYIDQLLKHLETSGIGLSIGSVYCGAPTVADDILLMANCPMDLQVMLHIANDYADKHQYKIHPIKSVVSVFGPKADREYWKNSNLWTISDHQLPISDQSTHLGLTRDVTSRNPISNSIALKVSLGKRTLYALGGAGLHGLNGLHPSICLHIYMVYVIPRMLSGLEAVVLQRRDMDELENCHRTFLRDIQNLPPNTATAGVYTLLGALPIEGILDMRCLTLYGAITRSKDTSIYQLARHQLDGEDLPPQSWFRHVQMLHQKYELNQPSTALESPLSKAEWKRYVTTAVRTHWEGKIAEDMGRKTSLKYLVASGCHLRKAHKLWSTVSNSDRDIRRGCVKAKLLCGIYKLQTHRSKFNQYEINPKCPMCLDADEDIGHFLLHCGALTGARRSYLPQLIQHLPGPVQVACAADDELLIQIILNCPTTVRVGIQQLYLKPDNIEAASRSLCYALHLRRATLLSYRP